MEESNPVGRPTKYKPEYCEQVEKLCRLGATDAEIADFFDVAESTINEWKLTHTEFSESIKRGKLEADANVADRLYQRALGYSHPDVDIKMYEGQIITTDLTKHYPPDPTSAIFWLKNRRKLQWRESQSIDHTTNGKEVGTGNISDDKLNAAIERLERIVSTPNDPQEGTGTA